MRVFSMVVALSLLTGAASAQGVSNEPIGNLAELMRGIMFPNSNKLFDLQSVEPGTELPEMSSEISEAVSAVMGPASSRFASIYRGWQDVEGAAVALADGAKLAMLEGRLCENGMPAPVDQADYIEGARLLEESAVKVLEAARIQDYDTASFAVNFLVESCSHCHRTYRDGPDSRQEPRCQ
jgi:hypothetical protein